MKPDIIEASPGSRWTRLAWFGLIWAASVLAIGLVAFMLRLILKR